MADKKISDFTAATATAVGDLEEIETAAGNSRKRRAGVSGTASDTSFPGGPTTGDRIWRSDRNIEYFYDGTRWLSTQQFVCYLGNQTISQPNTASGELNAVNPHWNDYDIYVEKFKMAGFNTQTTAANYYSCQFKKWDGASSTSLGSSVSQQNDTQNAWVTHDVSINAVVTSAFEEFNVAFAKTGAPTTYLSAAFTYRLVG